MKSVWLLAALLSGIPAHAWQGTTPEAALEEIATATKAEVIARHLPEPVQKSIESLPKPQKEHIMQELMDMKTSQFGGCTVRLAQNAEGWEIVDKHGKSKGRIRMANAFISGIDALLPLEIDFSDGPQAFIVTMHLEDHEWRIDNFGPWAKNGLGVEELLHQPTEMEKNETAARETMAEIANALRQYARGHPQNGYPHALPILTHRSGSEQEFLRNPLLDDSFAADPLIKNGYLFRYLLTNTGDGQSDFGEYELTAVPVEFGKTGSKSYLADAYRVHVSNENRPATQADPGPED
ncbi:MAG TPA: hypothetical protein VGJ51_18330 [Candidatus Angelobacter sp.]